ncbi:MAG: lipid A biosynthesis (KDO)2-(lauroyl)-lipid IVA acyltransferase [Bacteroidales bacterium]|nr:lipid A biosynthesis (KDO)2-(lauroyl)-lipid IVA acyltransferase [Bacteroidales bacterium]
MTSENRERKGTTGGGKLGQHGLLFLFHHINVRICYPFIALTIPFYMIFHHKAYSAIFHYFRQRFQFSAWKSFWKTFENHYLFGQMVLDRFAILAGGKSSFDVEISGQEYFDQLIHSKNGFLMASSHVGNFELSGYLLRQDKKPINAIIFGGERADLQEKRNRILLAHNIHPIPVKEDMSHLFALNQAVQNGEIITMPCDRILGSSKNVVCHFLGADAKFPVGSFYMAAQFQLPVVALFVMKEKAKKYHILVQPIEISNLETTQNHIANAKNLARSFAKTLEMIVKEYPTQWFNFYDFWKI